MKTTATQKYCMDILHTYSHTNWARNLENNSTLYTFTTLSTVQLTMQRF